MSTDFLAGVLLLGTFLGCFGIAYLLWKYAQKQRLKGLTEVAVKIGATFSPLDVDSKFGNFSEFLLFQRRNYQAVNDFSFCGL
jgi:hypothetical protein